MENMTMNNTLLASELSTVCKFLGNTTPTMFRACYEESFEHSVHEIQCKLLPLYDLAGGWLDAYENLVEDLRFQTMTDSNKETEEAAYGMYKYLAQAFVTMSDNQERVRLAPIADREGISRRLQQYANRFHTLIKRNAHTDGSTMRGIVYGSAIESFANHIYEVTYHVAVVLNRTGYMDEDEMQSLQDYIILGMALIYFMARSWKRCNLDNSFLLNRLQSVHNALNSEAL